MTWYRIKGLDRETGESLNLKVEAQTEDDAVIQAGKLGVVVEAVKAEIIPGAPGKPVIIEKSDKPDAWTMAHTGIIAFCIVGSLLVILIIYLLSHLTPFNNDESPSSPKDNQVRSDTEKQPTRYMTIDKKWVTQQKRKEAIQEYIDHGVFAKVDFRKKTVDVWVTPTFLILDFDAKEGLLDIVYAYAFEETKLLNSIQVIDNITGKNVGEYRLSNRHMGLKMK